MKRMILDEVNNKDEDEDEDEDEDKDSIIALFYHN